MISGGFTESNNNKGGSMERVGKNTFGGEHYKVGGMLDWGFDFIEHDKLAPMDSITDCDGEGKTVYVYMCPCCRTLSLRASITDVGICCCKSDEEFNEEVKQMFGEYKEK